jgi:sugar lactone lactonase YvrE
MKKHNPVRHVRHYLKAPLALGSLLVAILAGCSSSSGGSNNGDQGIGISNIAPAANDATQFMTPFDATPSPDGATVYFTALTLDGDPAIFTTPAAGGAVTKLASGAPLATPFGITISEDGQTLFVADATADANGDDSEAGAIYTLPVGGGTPAVLTGTAGMAPRGVQVSADQIYFTGIQSGKPGVFKAALAGGGVTQVGTSDLFSDPSGITVDKNGNVFVMDSSPDTAVGSALIKIDAQGNGAIFKDGLAVGHPAGIALMSDETAALVSGLDPSTGTDVVYRVELADASVKTFSDVIGSFTESAGLHRASTTDTFAWADCRANASGTVYVLSK